MKRLLATWFSLWPDQAQTIQQETQGIDMGTAQSWGAEQGAPTMMSKPGHGIHINPKYLAKAMGQSAPMQVCSYPPPILIASIVIYLTCLL